MIVPTVGRVVWFTPSRLTGEMAFQHHDATKPLAAMVAHVWGDRMVNLVVFDSNGVSFSRTSVTLLQDDDAKPDTGYFCSWMPYQVGQAKALAAVPAAPRMADEQIARVCHEVNRAFCASIGDNSQPAWADAPEWQRGSAVNGVKFSLANPDAPPSASHDSWSAEKRADGWVFGPVKDPIAKQHPCLVPYDELPVEQRSKDYLFQAVVRALA